MVATALQNKAKFFLGHPVEHSNMLKSYRVVVVVVAHGILVSAQVPLALTLGLWTLGLRTWA